VNVCSDEKETIRDRKSSFLRYHRCGVISSSRYHRYHRHACIATPISLAQLEEACYGYARLQAGPSDTPSTDDHVSDTSTVSATCRHALGTQPCHVRAHRRYINSVGPSIRRRCTLFLSVRPFVRFMPVLNDLFKLPRNKAFAL